MKTNVIKAEYYNIIINDSFGATEKMLECVAKMGISLLAYKSKQNESGETIFTLFALKSKEMANTINENGYQINGPFSALFIEGADVPGALGDIFSRLEKNKITIKESSGIANINHGYGVVLYLNKEDNDRAYDALNK